ncbi:MAG: hypothetical protein RBG13Loki_1544 [Promethearchaeota archaeon CR_4]|nr:MAG: hypothetical protein RBG13Loki_1544 [Candidatus Lokiarchaeota archaeon CR_4]
MSLREKLKSFFQGQSLSRNIRIKFVILNAILMLVIFYVVLNKIAYDWTGTMYAEGTGFRLDIGLGGVEAFWGLDNLIPFVPAMEIFYEYIFYPFVIVTMCFFAFVESKKGVALGWSLVLINLVAVLIYIVFPVSTYWWRDAITHSYVVGTDFWTDQIVKIFNNDPSFNCFPSLHAAVSTICFYAFYRYARITPGKGAKIMAGLSLVFATGIILSTMFVKQHYIADEISGIVLAWIVGKLFFDHFWRSIIPSPRREQ